jgi:hypothetical protein
MSFTTEDPLSGLERDLRASRPRFRINPELSADRADDPLGSSSG